MRTLIGLGLAVALAGESLAATPRGCESAVAAALRSCTQKVAAVTRRCWLRGNAPCAPGDGDVANALARLERSVLVACPTPATVAAAGFGGLREPAALVARLRESCRGEPASIAARSFGGPQGAVWTGGDAAAHGCLSTAFKEASRLLVRYAAVQHGCVRRARRKGRCDVAQTSARTEMLTAAAVTRIEAACPALADLIGLEPPAFVGRAAAQARCMTALAHGEPLPLDLDCGPAAADSVPQRGVWTRIVLDEATWGTRCGDGSAYAFWLRLAPAGNPVERIVVDMQGGGACLFESDCLGVRANSPFLFRADDEGAPAGGYQADDPAANVFANWTRLFLPYCTQDLHIGGGTQSVFPGITVNRYGAVNARAAFRYLRGVLWRALDDVDSDGFRPDRLTVMLAGESAGAWGVRFNYHYLLDDLRWIHTTAVPDGAMALDNGQPLGVRALGLLINIAGGFGWGGQSEMPPYCLADDCGVGTVLQTATAARLKATPEQQVLNVSNQADPIQVGTNFFSGFPEWINACRAAYCMLQGTNGIRYWLPADTSFHTSLPDFGPLQHAHRRRRDARAVAGAIGNGGSRRGGRSRRRGHAGDGLSWRRTDRLPGSARRVSMAALRSATRRRLLVAAGATLGAVGIGVTSEREGMLVPEPHRRPSARGVAARTLLQSRRSLLHVWEPARHRNLERAVVLYPSLARLGADFDVLTAALLRAGHRVLVVDPLLVESTVATTFRIADLVADAMELLDAAGVASVDVVGHAFGSRVMRLLSILHPDRVASLVCIACGGRVPPAPDVTRDLLASFDLELADGDRLPHVARAFFAPGNDFLRWRFGWVPRVGSAEVTASLEHARAPVFPRWSATGPRPAGRPGRDRATRERHGSLRRAQPARRFHRAASHRRRGARHVARAAGGHRAGRAALPSTPRVRVESRTCRPGRPRARRSRASRGMPARMTRLATLAPWLRPRTAMPGSARSPSRRSATPRPSSRASSGNACGRASGCSPGREADVAQPGDWFTFEIGAESILVARDRARTPARALQRLPPSREPALRAGPRPLAHLHRAATTPGSGTSTARCAAPPTRETFPQGLPPDLRLGPLRCETWGGFVWVTMDPNAEPLADVPRRHPRASRAVPLRGARAGRRRDPRGRRATGRRASTPSTRPTTCRARTRSCSSGPTT